MRRYGPLRNIRGQIGFNLIHSHEVLAILIPTTKLNQDKGYMVISCFSID
jgi:hypothetical protein